MEELQNPMTNDPQAQTASSDMQSVIADNLITKAFASRLFMVMTILVGCSVGLGFITSAMDGSLSLDIINLLLLIGMWTAHLHAKNTNTANNMPVSGLNLISGTVKACRIISLSVSILCSVLGGICGVVSVFVITNPDTHETVVAEIQAILYFVGNNALRFADTPDAALPLVIGLTIGFFAAGILVLILVYRLFFRYFHCFTYSLCENIKNQTPLTDARSLVTWLLVIGILQAVCSVTNLLAGGTLATATILASVWIRKYFCHTPIDSFTQDKTNSS